MAQAKAGAGFLLGRPLPKTRYVLTCARSSPRPSRTTDRSGGVQREHFMRLHDTAKIEFVVLDRWKNETRVVN